MSVTRSPWLNSQPAGSVGEHAGVEHDAAFEAGTLAAPGSGAINMAKRQQSGQHGGDQGELQKASFLVTVVFG